MKKAIAFFLALGALQPLIDAAALDAPVHAVTCQPTRKAEDIPAPIWSYLENQFRNWSSQQHVTPDQTYQVYGSHKEGKAAIFFYCEVFSYGASFSGGDIFDKINVLAAYFIITKEGSEEKIEIKYGENGNIESCDVPANIIALGWDAVSAYKAVKERIDSRWNAWTPRVEVPHTSR